jgi:hypothetical protein
MRYNLADLAQCDQAFEYLTELVGKHAITEIKHVRPKRSLAQNNYLHLIIAAFGAHFGYTSDEAKLIYKELNAGVFKYEKKGRTFLRSTADLDKLEMTKSIDRFRQASAEQGYPLPLATDQEWLMAIQNEIERSEHWL